MPISDKKLKIKIGDKITKPKLYKFSPEKNQYIEVILVGEFSDDEISDLNIELDKSLNENRHDVMVSLVMQ